jgi:hypothetical protein
MTLKDELKQLRKVGKENSRKVDLARKQQEKEHRVKIKKTATEKAKAYYPKLIHKIKDKAMYNDSYQEGISFGYMCPPRVLSEAEAPFYYEALSELLLRAGLDAHFICSERKSCGIDDGDSVYYGIGIRWS